MNDLKTYNLLIIGGGLAGVMAAMAASTFGNSVALVDKQQDNSRRREMDARPEGEIHLRGEKIVIATGSSPVRPDIFPFGQGEIYDSDTVPKLVRIPKILAVVGAGVIGSKPDATDNSEYGKVFR